jgi:hypothetical protein
VLRAREGEGGAAPLATVLHACAREKQREASCVVCVGEGDEVREREDEEEGRSVAKGGVVCRLYV